jgi:putative transposase
MMTQTPSLLQRGSRMRRSHLSGHTRDHLRGNETKRIPHKLLRLMTQAWEEIGLDLKCTSVSSVLHHLEMLIRGENESWRRNGLKPLMVSSQTTLRMHHEFLITPTEHLVATKGPREGRSKRGRGSTDFGALFVGQVCEADEVRLSLIISAKERGYWEKLSSNDQKTVEEIDKEIRRQFTLLARIDVASRMPIAWVVSDQPKAEATLALLRMAKRDKTKEKIKYGCSGDPAPAMAIGKVKTDNGVGLRAKRVIQALLGAAATLAAVRTHASADIVNWQRWFRVKAAMSSISICCLTAIRWFMRTSGH